MLCFHEVHDIASDLLKSLEIFCPLVGHQRLSRLRRLFQLEGLKARADGRRADLGGQERSYFWGKEEGFGRLLRGELLALDQPK